MVFATYHTTQGPFWQEVCKKRKQLIALIGIAGFGHRQRHMWIITHQILWGVFEAASATWRQLSQQSSHDIIIIDNQFSHLLTLLRYTVCLRRHKSSKPKTSRSRSTVRIEGLPLPRSISFTVAKLTPDISARSTCVKFSFSRLVFMTSLRFILVYYNILFRCKDSLFSLSETKSLLKYTF